MVVGIHKDRYGKFCRFLERYEEILDANGIEHVRLDCSDIDFWEKVAHLDLFIFRWQQIDDDHQLAKTILPVIGNHIGVKTFPDDATCWHYDDKIRQYYLLHHYGFPIARSWVFWNKRAALEWVQRASFPLVFKLKGGAGSNNVVMLNNRGQARRLVRRMFGRGIRSGKIPSMSNVRWKDFNLRKTAHRWGGNVLRLLRGEDASPDWGVHKNYAFFQEFLPNNAYDTRVTVIGRRAFAFRRLNRRNDFRSSGSGRIEYDQSKIDLRFVREALRVSLAMSFQSMAYDFLYDNSGNPVFCEISYTYLDEAVFRCPGYWDDKLHWHEGHYWPQYFHLMDALNVADLKQPNIS
jgi:glutathione synthase/RimK-type ligase-like ATP-grasp enzyme